MRTLLLVSLLALSFGLTAFSLLAVRFTLHRQIQRDLRSDLQHSVDTFFNLQHQRREMLARETALLADLPSLKALMTTQDVRTIQDQGKDFWQISGSDIFQLYDPSGSLVASYGPGQPAAGTSTMSRAGQSTRAVLEQPEPVRTLAVGDGVYDVIAQPLSFGSRVNGSVLGYVLIGSSIDRHVAQEVRQAAAAEVAFTVNGRVAVSTLSQPMQAMLNDSPILRQLAPGATADLSLGGERFLAAVRPLNATDPYRQEQVQLVVLRSYDDSTHLLRDINRWLLGLGLLALLLGTLVSRSISRLFTRPLEALVDGARAFGLGEFNYPLSSGGTAEIRELTHAFDHMRIELGKSQRALVDSERLATIGRMASSISHDLRHYISAMYANAEFLSLVSTPQAEREELILEVQSAVHGMTDLLDSLLGFSRTGKALIPSYESLPYLIERASSLLRAHPEANLVNLRLERLENVEAWVDATKFIRATFNLLLNACQAAKHSSARPTVIVEMTENSEEIVLRIEDNGPGVPASIIDTMFEPFVSRDRENGTGLGLTLAQHIAQEHGGRVRLESSVPGKTVFSLNLNKNALKRFAVPSTVAREHKEERPS